MKRAAAALFIPLFILLILLSQQVFAQNTEGEPRLEPDPQAVNFARNHNPGDWRRLLELAYWGSGDPDWKASADDYAPVIEKFAADAVRLEERERAEAVLEFMHEEFLNSYQLKQSSLPVLFSTGRFNCLSSAVLYAVIGTAVGLDVSGVNTVDHAFCSVRVGGELVDVETTNPHGFNPGAKNEFKDAFGKTTGFSYVPPANYRDRNSIDLLKLFSLLLQNRIADAEDSGRFSEAVGIAVDRWVLLGGGRGAEYEDLVIRMLNYGAKLSRAGREEDALAWAEKASSVYGEHPKFDDFIDGVVNNLLVKLVRAGRIEDARRRYAELNPRLTAEMSARLNYMISESELLTALDAVMAGGRESIFTAELERAKHDGVLTAQRIREAELNWRLYRINLIAAAEDWTAAFEAVESAIAEMGYDPQLEKARRIYLSNRKAVLYNAAADAFNARRFEDARSLVDTALLEFPGDPNFQNLLRMIERARTE